MTDLFDNLEYCLREIEGGADIESVLARFPEHAAELRPILKTAVKAKSMASGEPSPDVLRRSRAKVLQRAAQLRESSFAPRRRAIPAFSRLAISFALTALFLASGAGLINVSASALPGENLYPVKRGWENIRLFFIFDPHAREILENEFEHERFDEVNELIAEGRHETIQFAGVFMQVNGVAYVSGLQVILPEGMQIPANGSAVIISGQTNAQGFVEALDLELLPEGSVVPIGNPIEVESESETGEDSNSNGDSSPGSGDEAHAIQPAEYEITGTLESVTNVSMVISGMTVHTSQVEIDGQLCVGMEVEAKGYYAEDGAFVALEIKGEGECAQAAPSDPNSNSGEGSNENSGSGDPGDDNSSGQDNSNTDGGSNEDNSNDDGDDDSNDEEDDD